MAYKVYNATSTSKALFARYGILNGQRGILSSLVSSMGMIITLDETGFYYLILIALFMVCILENVAMYFL